MKIVDTDIFIDFFRGVPAAISYLRQNADTILFSAITEAELLSGQICNSSSEREKVCHVLSQFEKIPADNPLVQIAGDFRRKYGVDLPDALIAASAYMIDSPLVTRNKIFFEPIKEIKVEVPY